MTFRSYQRAGETTEWDFEEVQAHLASRGIALGPGGVGTGADGFVRVDVGPGVTDAAWTAALDAFVPSPDPERIARGYLRTRFRAIIVKTPAQRAAATLNENDLLMVIRVLRQDS